MTDETDLSKVDLLDRIESGWRELNALVRGLDETQLTRVDEESGWAVTDHLTHLAAWERGIAYLLSGRPRHAGMGISKAQWDELTMDEVNAEIYRQGRERGAADTLTHFRGAHMDMLDALEGLEDADLQRDYSAYDPEEESSGRPIIGWIIGDTYGHYEEHLGYIRASLDRRPHG